MKWYQQYSNQYRDSKVRRACGSNFLEGMGFYITLKQMIADYVFNDEMKSKIIDKLNDNVDVPFISEKTEEKILIAIYDSVEEVVKEAILK